LAFINLQKKVMDKKAKLAGTFGYFATLVRGTWDFDLHLHFTTLLHGGLHKQKINKGAPQKRNETKLNETKITITITITISR